jgi:RNA polymerase sigma-70 factor (ECF subfamily)
MERTETSARAEERLPVGTSEAEPTAADETGLVEKLRGGDAEAGRRFIRDHYPDVYRYLLFLTGRPDRAEDLTQETFLRAWRGIAGFEGRSSLRVWLHRIAHREFLRALRAQRTKVDLEQVAEAAASAGGEWSEGVELQDALRGLPVAEREVVTLHYLQGYSCEEIAEIVRAPIGTVKYRLSSAWAHLQQQLGEDDLLYLNEPSLPMRGWAWLPLEEMRALEARIAWSEEGPNMPSDRLSRREFLTAAAGAGAALATGSGADVIDVRLTHKVTLAFKATALSDLCAHLTAETGIKIAAGASVANDSALRAPITLLPEASCGSQPKVTTADVLEALHHATGMPIVADYYTRLYPPGAVTVNGVPLFEGLNQLSDTMRLRWSRDGARLQFRSASFYDDRLKEVPNRLLAGWTASRRHHGALTLDDLIEIAQLSNARLGAAEMAEGARESLGLAEWDRARSATARPHLRFLARLTPAQRREAERAAGLSFSRLSLAQQQYLALGPAQAVHQGADGADRFAGLEELATATFRVDYTLPGRVNQGGTACFAGWQGNHRP